MNWISVKKELPEYSERVLISAIKEYETGEAIYWIDIAYRRLTNKNGHHWMNAKDDLSEWNVTHWMPLPKTTEV